MMRDLAQTTSSWANLEIVDAMEVDNGWKQCRWQQLVGYHQRQWETVGTKSKTDTTDGRYQRPPNRDLGNSPTFHFTFVEKCVSQRRPLVLDVRTLYTFCLLKIVNTFPLSSFLFRSAAHRLDPCPSSSGAEDDVDARIGVDDIAQLTRLKSVCSLLYHGDRPHSFPSVPVIATIRNAPPDNTHLERLLHLVLTKPTKVTSFSVR
jgi:hypothetical protein